MKRIYNFNFMSLDKEKYKYFITGNDFKYDEIYEKNGYLICIEDVEGVKFIDFLEIKRNGDFEYKSVFDELFKNNNKLGISFHKESKVKILAKRLKNIYSVVQEIKIDNMIFIILKKEEKEWEKAIR